MKVVLIFLMFFILSALLVINNNNLQIFNQKDNAKFLELYLNWGDIFYSNAKNLTGNIAKINWFPSNEK